MIKFKGPGWAYGCEECKFGLREDGSYCDCKAGTSRQASDERRREEDRKVLQGHVDPLPLDVIPVRYRDNTGEDVIRFFGDDKGKVDALNAVRAWTVNPRDKPSLLLEGPVGTGKTTIAFLAVRSFLLRGIRAEAVSLYDWFNRLQSLPLEQAAADVERLKSVSVLFIDDLGSQERTTKHGAVEFETARRIELVRQLLDTRINDRKRTIIATNLTPKAIEAQFGERIASRLAEDFVRITVAGRDLRVGGEL